MKVYIMIGFPGSGKTTYAEANLVSDDCIRLDGDSLKTAARVNAALLNVLRSGKSVIVDATNMTLARRIPLFEVLNEFKANNDVECDIIGIWFQMSLEDAYVRNKLREKPVSKIAYYKLRKDFVEPNLDEGFTEIIKL